ncbi:putative toxin-antitoxin system toxin component, PIN family [Parapedobacter tibetensis]|uniref:putative toxin-antitoxin system toxin component, PIN family n=1 Tax=Parapedobacter tibetensis TaxID=2972951 RepID=UPI00356B74FD
MENFDALANYVIPRHTLTDCRDPKDNKFLELAVSAKAHAIVTGDLDLLILHP